MNFRLLTFALCLFLLNQKFAGAQNQKTRLSAGTRLLLNKIKENKELNNPGSVFVFDKDANNKLYVNMLAKTNSLFNQQDLDKLGIWSGKSAGNIITLKVPLNKVNEFCALKGFDCIDTDLPQASCMDSARFKTRVDSVHAGIWLPQVYNGEGVLTGIIDAGFDYTHPAFYDTSLTHYRVKKVWEQKTMGTPPVGFTFGNELSDSISILNKAFDIYTGTHGTHVAGIAAGSGFAAGNNRKYRGMAYKSDLAFVAIYPDYDHWLNTGLTDMLNGIQYLFDYADQISKPVVVNLSWGGPIGPRDGKSLFSQALDNLTGPGKIFVVSGGNNGDNNIHIGKTFTSTDTLLNTFCTFSSSLTEKRNLIDIWGDSTSHFCVKFRLLSANLRVDSTVYVCPDDSVHSLILKGGNGDTLFIKASSVTYDVNGKPHILLEILSRVNERFNIQISCNGGKVHMWQGFVLNSTGYYGIFTKYTYTWAENGDATYTTSDMVSSNSAIGVGAYNSKVKFTNVSGNTLAYTGYANNNLALFSSKGPTADERVKPDITGPGLALASSVSIWDSAYAPGGSNASSTVAAFTSPLNGQTYRYAVAAGTSMSAPSVSGIIALMLQANPLLSPGQIKSIFNSTAILDNFTGNLGAAGNTSWGHGKVNAWKALVSVLNSQGFGFQSKNPLQLLPYPNPANNQITLSWKTDESGPATVQLTDLSGRLVKQECIVSQAWNNQLVLNLDQLDKGIYLITVKSNSESETCRFTLY